MSTQPSTIRDEGGRSARFVGHGEGLSRSGSASYHLAMLLALLVYSYATGVFSSRKIERATHDSVAFRFISANQNPDHEALATFRWWFLKEIEALFVEVKIEARVEESYVREQADYQAKLATREEKIERTGKSARGKIIRAAQGGRSDQPDR